MPGELEDPRDGVAVRGVSCVCDRQRAGRVRRDHLDLDPLGRRGSRAGAERVARLEDLPERVGEPGVGDVEVDEPRPGGLGRLDQAPLDGAGRNLGGQIARRLLPRRGESKRDVRRVVAVARIGRALELDGRAREVGELRF